MVRQFSIKKILSKIMMLLMSLFILISSYACTLTPRSFGIAELLYSTCAILNAEIYDTNGNHIDTDEYGRVLATSYNVADKNKASKKETLILYTIFYLNEKKGTYFQYIPDKYYYLASEDNKDSEEFKQFLKDNYWGVKYDDSIKNNYVTSAKFLEGYDVNLEEREKIDNKVKSRITNYIALKELFSSEDFEFANKIYDRYNKYIFGVIQKSTGSLFGAYVNYENEEEEIKIVPISYDNYRDDLNALKKSVDWYETEPIE